MLRSKQPRVNAVPSNNENVNIYMNNDTVKQDVFQNCSPHEKYIILSNETLQMENRKLNKLICELQAKNKEFEDELDRYDTATRYSKGLLKNLVELEKMRSVILANTEQDFSLVQTSYNKNSRINRYIYRTYEISLIVFFAILFQLEFYSIGQFLLQMLFVCGSFVIFERVNGDIHISKNIENEKLEAKIKKITDSQDFLFDYIDNL